MVMSFHTWVCFYCKEVSAISFCLCDGSLLCADCMTEHFTKFPGRVHSSYPVHAYQFRTVPGYFERLNHRSANWPLAKHALRQNVLQVEACAREVTLTAERMVKFIQDSAQRETLNLDKLRKQISEDIEAAIDATEKTMYEDSPNLPSPYCTLLRCDTFDVDTFRLFDYRLSCPPPDSLFSLSYTLKALQSPTQSILPRISRHSVVLHDLCTDDYESYQLSFPYRASFCQIDPDTVLCVGGGPPVATAFMVDLQAISLSPISPMHTARKYPGVIKHSSYVYIFGGNDPSITACEKFSVEAWSWTKLPDMKNRRSSFSPCASGDCIYLPDVGQSHKAIEVFHVASESFSTFPTPLPVSLSGTSVSLIHNGELLILTSRKQLIRTRLDCQAGFEVKALQMTNINSATANIGPVRVGTDMFWARWTDAGLVRFSLTEFRLLD